MTDRTIFSNLIKEFELILEPIGSMPPDIARVELLLEELDYDTEAFPDVAAITSGLNGLLDFISQPPLIPNSLTDLPLFLESLQKALDGLRKLSSTNGTHLPTELAEVGTELLESLIIRYLRRHRPLVWVLMLLLGLADDETMTALEPPLEIGGETLRRARLRPRLALDKLGSLLREPGAFMRSRWMPNGLVSAADADAAADRLFPVLATLVRLLGGSAITGYQKLPELGLSGPSAMLAEHMLTVVIAHFDTNDVRSTIGLSTAFDPPDRSDLGFVLIPFGQSSISNKLDTWDATFQASAGVDAVSIKAGKVSVLPRTGASDNIFNLALQIGKPARTGDEPFRIGLPQATRIEMDGVMVRASGIFGANAPEWNIEIAVENISLIVEAGDGDGFVKNILPPEGLHASFALTLGWSNGLGLYFKGGPQTIPGQAIKADIPLAINLGPIIIQSVYTEIAPSSTGVNLNLTLITNLLLGPIRASVEGFGLGVSIVPTTDGNLGPVDGSLHFKPPNGVGLAIDAGVVIGGGFLSFDDKTAQYTGMVQLEIGGQLSLSAFALITTRMPNGAPGFSLLVLISSEFNPAIQLGYGFTLNGIGGILGVNRTTAVDVLRAGLRSGALGSILFPQDPIRNAPQIVSDLAAVFPPVADRFLFGPVAKLGWGTPTLWTLDLGLILELPAPVRLILLGRLRVLLPEEQVAIVRLQLDSVGVIDFTSGDVSLDAVLYDSVVAQYAVTGQMALRANFGSAPGFALSIGGFHPGFHAPTAFPSLERVAISLATGDNPRLRLAAYLALTTNTIQFGAHVELFAKLGPFSAEGLLGFDTLIRIAPFGFVAEIGAIVAIKFDQKVLLATAIEMSLTGPTPWHAWGHASFRFLGFSKTIEFSVQIGQEEPPPLPAPVQLRPLLLEALQQPGNWATRAPQGGSALVTIRAQPSEQVTLVHPLASLQVSQRVLPLGRDITRFGNTIPEGVRIFTLGVADFVEPQKTLTANDSQDIEVVQDFFAPAQFREMTDDEKLNAPGFEKQPSGIRFTPQGYICGKPVIERNMQFDQDILFSGSIPAAPQSLESETIEPYQITASFLERVAETGAAGRVGLANSGVAKYRDGIPKRGFGLKPPNYRVVGGQELQAVPQALIAATPAPIELFDSYAAAAEAVRQKTDRAGQHARLRVIPYFGG